MSRTNPFDSVLSAVAVVKPARLKAQDTPVGLKVPPARKKEKDCRVPSVAAVFSVVNPARHKPHAPPAPDPGKEGS
jgi:hypothetical protein